VSVFDLSKYSMINLAIKSQGFCILSQIKSLQKPSVAISLML